MSISFRGRFLVGLALALCIGLYLVWLWRPERQISRHTENFLHAIEHKNWTAAGDFIASDYQDQSGDDRARVLERMREGFRYVRGIQIYVSNATLRIERRGATWTGKITIDGEEGEAMDLLKERVNSLATPFQLEWRRISAKPWDWQLVRVSNSALEIPAEVY